MKYILKDISVTEDKNYKRYMEPGFDL